MRPHFIPPDRFTFHFLHYIAFCVKYLECFVPALTAADLASSPPPYTTPPGSVEGIRKATHLPKRHLEHPGVRLCCLPT